MALGSCKECGQSVSTRANICPHCGIENPTVGFFDVVGWIIGLGVIYFIFLK